MRKPRTTENFVRLLTELDAATDSQPENLKLALESHPNLTAIVVELHNLFLHQIENHRRFSKSRFIPQAYPGFGRALKRYKEVWSASWLETLPDLDLSGLDEIVLEPKGEAVLATYVEDDEWDFDPDHHSASEHINGVMENSAAKSNEHPFFCRADQAWQWFNGTIGLDLTEMEKRWHEFPVVLVKQIVSDRHGLKQQKSLYAYLDNVRKAYVVGADLAALAMLRSTTEILMRFHYNDNDEKTNLTKLVTDTVSRYSMLGSYDLSGKIFKANKLLHFNSQLGTEQWQDVRVLVRNWYLILNELIEHVPDVVGG